MEEFFTLPSGLFFGMVAQLYSEELDHFAPCDTVLLIQDNDMMLRIRQVSLDWCHVHFFSYDTWKIS
jgi:hypothetical protein